MPRKIVLTLATAVAFMALGFTELVRFWPESDAPTIKIEVGLDPLKIKIKGDAALEKIDAHSIRLTSDSGNLAVALQPDEAIYGLTERIVDNRIDSESLPRAVGGLDRRGEFIRMWVLPTISGYASFYISSRGYGMVVEGSNPGTYDIGKSDPDAIKISWYVKGGRFSCVFIGGSYIEIMDRYTQLTGRPILPPKWVFLPWKWRDECMPLIFNKLDNVVMNAEVVDDITHYEKLDLPVGVYMIDRPWAEGEMGYGNYSWDPKRFPNGDEMVKVLQARGWHVVVWGAPWAIGRRDRHFGPEAEAKGYKVSHRNLDYTNPEVVEWHGEKIQEFLRRSNVNGWKLDRSEETNPSTEADIYHDGRNGIEVHNDYPRLYIKNYHDATRAVRGDDFVLMPRASYTGSQQWSIVWGGDTRGCIETFPGFCKSTDKGLRSVIISLQRMAMMGFPVWGSDTGGYATFRSRDVFARWLELSCFCPLMEIGGVDSHQPWDMPTRPKYDPEMIRIFHRYTWIHARLADYTYKLAQRAHRTGNPIIHPLVFDWPDDPAVKDMWDQYMYGPSLLVAPVWEEGSRKREVYLPAGDWIDLWDESKTFRGPATMTVDVPLDRIPVYIKADSKPLLPAGLTEGL